MELSFATRKLRSEALDRSCAEGSYGAKTAIELHARLADLHAAVTVVDLPPVTGWQVLASELRVRLSADEVLVCAPVLASEAVDWARVHRLRVLGIEAAR